MCHLLVGDAAEEISRVGVVGVDEALSAGEGSEEAVEALLASTVTAAPLPINPRQTQ